MKYNSKVLSIYLDKLENEPEYLQFSAFFREVKASLNLMDTDSQEVSIWEYSKTDQNNNLEDLLKKEKTENLKLGLNFLNAVGYGDLELFFSMLDDGFNPNFQHPETGFAPIHYMAASGSRDLVRKFMKYDGIKFLVEEHRNLLPSNLAAYYNEDPVVCRYLRLRESIALRAGEKVKGFIPSNSASNLDQKKNDIHHP